MMLAVRSIVRYINMQYTLRNLILISHSYTIPGNKKQTAAVAKSFMHCTIFYQPLPILIMWFPWIHLRRVGQGGGWAHHQAETSLIQLSFQIF